MGVTKRRIARILTRLALVIALLALGFALLPPAKGIPVLEYHQIGEPEDAESKPYCVPPEEFSAQLDYLAAQGYTTISMLDFMKAKKGKAELPDKPILLTFDDGYEDNYTNMLPILEAHDMRATVYVVTNDIGKKGYLTWPQLRDMQDRGVEIGSHTANHLPLTTLVPEQVEDELKLSKLLLEWNGIRTVFAFSYPNGAYTPEIAERVKANEYLTAVTGDAGLNTFETNPYELQRTNIPYPRLGLTEFRLRLWKSELFARLGLFQHKES